MPAKKSPRPMDYYDAYPAHPKSEHRTGTKTAKGRLRAKHNKQIKADRARAKKGK